jgi:hypothetical protein
MKDRLEVCATQRLVNHNGPHPRFYVNIHSKDR